MAARASPGRAGTRVGPWTLGDAVGRGAHCSVYRGRDRDGREAALKVLDIKTAPMDAHEAFWREAAVMERFSHKNMPKFHGLVTTTDYLALSMQMARHGDALDYLNSTGPMSETAAALIFGQLCRILASAHKNGICHRDVKLENLLLDGDTVLLCDWGFAAFARPSEYLTKPCGTQGYCAPEIMSGVPYSGTAADLYSAGVVLYALLIGALPSAGPKPNRVAKLSDEVRELLTGLLTLEPADRWTMQQVKACRWWKRYCEEQSGFSRAVKGVLRRLSSS